MKIKNIHLKSPNLKKTKDYYSQVLKMIIHQDDGQVVSLGSKNHEFLFFHHSSESLNLKKQNGLYHFAILFEKETDFANLLVHMLKNKYPLVGASDHQVAKALYLQDPNGYGIEFYVDKPVQEERNKAKIQSKSQILNWKKELKKQTEVWQKMPDDAHLGHLHFSSNSLEKSRLFYCDALGLKETSQVVDALFLSDKNYHHDLAINIWREKNLEKNNHILSVELEIDQVQREKVKKYIKEENQDFYLLQAPDGILIKLKK